MAQIMGRLYFKLNPNIAGSVTPKNAVTELRNAVFFSFFPFSKKTIAKHAPACAKLPVKFAGEITEYPYSAISCVLIGVMA